MSLEFPSAFPQGQDRKKLLQEAKQWAEEYLGQGGRLIEEQDYHLLDSPLEEPKNNRYRHPVSFSASFESVIPPDSDPTFRDYIEHSLMERKGRAIGIEFGGIGSNLFTGFTKGTFQKTFAVTLADHRSPEEIKKAKRTEESKGIEHNIIEGDMLQPEVYQKIFHQLKGEKVDLIIERMIGGLNSIPLEPYLLGKIISIWYAMLREGGMMFVQTRVGAHAGLVKAWQELIEKEYKGKLELQCDYSPHNINAKGSGFRLSKLAGAPAELPLVDPRKVDKIGHDLAKEMIHVHNEQMENEMGIEELIEEEMHGDNDQ